MASVTGCGPAPAARFLRLGGARVVPSPRPERSRPTVLPRPNRMRRSEDFRRTVRRGVRIGRPTLVLHAVQPPGPHDVRVGFVVGKAVGNAVTRNRVRRRLRHLVRDRLHRLPDGTRLVVRVLPAASTATSDQLGRALDRALDRVVPS